MTTGCFCDYDPPEFLFERIRRARKTYICQECRGVILPGEVHEYVFGKWDGCVDSFRVCERCRDIRVWTKNNVPCLCGSYGNLDYDCAEAIEDAMWRAPDETRGLRFGFLRRVVARDKFNSARRAG